MGANTKVLRNRIKSVDSTLHLTKAMGLVASSKMRRVIDAMEKDKSRNMRSVCVWRLGKWYSLNRVVKKILTEKC